MAERKGGKASKGFTQEERDAMRERARELKAAARGSAAIEEGAVLAKIAAMPATDRAMGERVHAIIRNTAPVLSQGSGTGCPHTRRTAR